MPQDFSRGRKVSRTAQMGATLLRAAFGAALGVALVGPVMGLAMSAARAQSYGSDNGSAWAKFMQKLGLEKSVDADADINYTERSPLVVPPTRDLPPPAAGPPVAADWPQDPKHPKHAKAKRAPVPASATPVMANPNPPFRKKTWYNPTTWFSKEEYAAFTGEPPRDKLTDPPVGYRTPSPEQPYGIGPDKKGDKKAAKASDFNMTPATPPSGSGK